MGIPEHYRVVCTGRDQSVSNGAPCDAEYVLHMSSKGFFTCPTFRRDRIVVCRHLFEPGEDGRAGIYETPWNSLQRIISPCSVAVVVDRPVGLKRATLTVVRWARRATLIHCWCGGLSRVVVGWGDGFGPWALSEVSSYLLNFTVILEH